MSCRLFLAVLIFPLLAFGQETKVAKPIAEEAEAAPATTEDKEPPSVPAEAEVEAEEIPPPLTEYMGREIARTMHWMAAGWLVRHKREREESVAEMRQALELKPGMVVCDMGCGNGYHTLPMAQAVGETGAVYAVDAQPEMIRMLEERADGRGLKNLKPIVNTYHDAMLPEDAIDLLLMVDVYHEFSYPVRMLAGIRASLREGGQIVLVEFREEDKSVPIKPEHKMSKAQVDKEMVANGFRLARSYEDLPWQHMLFYEKDPDWAGPPAPAEGGEQVGSQGDEVSD